MAGTLELPAPHRPVLVLHLRGDVGRKANLPEKMALMCKNTCMFPQMDNPDTLPSDLLGIQGPTRLASLTTQSEQLAAPTVALIPDAHILTHDPAVRIQSLDRAAGAPVLAVCPQKFKAFRDGCAGPSKNKARCAASGGPDNLPPVDPGLIR